MVNGGGVEVLENAEAAAREVSHGADEALVYVVVVLRERRWVLIEFGKDFFPSALECTFDLCFGQARICLNCFLHRGIHHGLEHDDAGRENPEHVGGQELIAVNEGNEPLRANGEGFHVGGVARGLDFGFVRDLQEAQSGVAILANHIPGGS